MGDILKSLADMEWPELDEQTTAMPPPPETPTELTHLAYGSAAFDARIREAYPQLYRMLREYERITAELALATAEAANASLLNKDEKADAFCELRQLVAHTVINGNLLGTTPVMESLFDALIRHGELHDNAGHGTVARDQQRQIEEFRRQARVIRESRGRAD